MHWVLNMVSILPNHNGFLLLAILPSLAVQLFGTRIMMIGHHSVTLNRLVDGIIHQLNNTWVMPVFVVSESTKTFINIFLNFFCLSDQILFIRTCNEADRHGSHYVNDNSERASISTKSIGTGLSKGDWIRKKSLNVLEKYYYPAGISCNTFRGVYCDQIRRLADKLDSSAISVDKSSFSLLNSHFICFNNSAIRPFKTVIST